MKIKLRVGGRVPALRDYLVRCYLDESKMLQNNPEDVRTAHMLLGPPGIGKTQAAYEAAKIIAGEVGKTFLVYYDSLLFDAKGRGAEIEKVLSDPEGYFVYTVFPVNLAEPTDFLGIPVANGELGVTLYRPHLWVKIQHLTPGILVLDDFLDTQREDTLSAAYRVMLEKVMGFLPLHRDRMIIATSNTPEYSSLSREMPTPLVTRMEIHEVAPPTVDEWAEWMRARYGNNWDKRVYAFLKARESEGLILKLPDSPQTNKPYPCPRSWTRLARRLYFGEVDVEGTIGAEIGQQFVAFANLQMNIEDLIGDPEKWDTLNYDSKFMAALLLASWMNQHQNDLSSAVPLLTKMVGDTKELLLVMSRVVELKVWSKVYQQLPKGFFEKIREVWKEVKKFVG
ncbi:MAG: hypothetical protein QXR87_04235 [Candidatus Hadarchaeales archaeon]